MEAHPPPHDLLNDDTMRTVPDVVDFITFDGVTPAIPERSSRTICDPSVETHIEDVANTRSIYFPQPPMSGSDVGGKHTRPRCRHGLRRTATVYLASFYNMPRVLIALLVTTAVPSGTIGSLPSLPSSRTKASAATTRFNSSETSRIPPPFLWQTGTNPHVVPSTPDGRSFLAHRERMLRYTSNAVATIAAIN
jgi:hypothetical protein